MEDFEVVMENIKCNKSLFQCKTCKSYTQFPMKLLDKYKHDTHVRCGYCGVDMFRVETFDLIKTEDGYNIRSTWEIEDDPEFQLVSSMWEK